MARQTTKPITENTMPKEDRPVKAKAKTEYVPAPDEHVRYARYYRGQWLVPPALFLAVAFLKSAFGANCVAPNVIFGTRVIGTGGATDISNEGRGFARIASAYDSFGFACARVLPLCNRVHEYIQSADLAALARGIAGSLELDPATLESAVTYYNEKHFTEQEQ